ncbi:FAD-dependent oxidoreductase [uncultured Actinomyces sp.]|uniref:FAD-dependent oxidoreductase n=1 Tax=uncultured Actinomyces sp. TaxID=249061 RepID=UPI0026153EAE|nr:FAD-dependent oxidoreductase [uncultured Actinomyces sp.]
MYDAIVIGSGIGSLTTAGLLAGVAKKRVLVLEKHSTPGGLTHAFRRQGASWDVGLHYVGDMAPGTRPRQIIDYLTGGKLSWTQMPDSYDRFCLPKLGVNLDVPSDAGVYRQRLEALFPKEKRALKRYFKGVARAYSWMTLNYVRQLVPQQVAPLIGLAQKVHTSLACETTAHYMKRLFHNPALRTLLTTHWGDYGVEPERSAFVAHAMIVGHYMNGEWFPQGGSGQISRMIEEKIRANGGEIRIAQSVEEILVQNGRAVGVRVTDTSGAQPVTYEEHASIIVSGAGASETYNRLLPTQGSIGKLTEAIRKAIARMGQGGSAVIIYLTLDHYPEGIDGSNIWINEGDGSQTPAELTTSLLKGTPQTAFVSFPGLKAGDQHATAEIVSFVEAGAFRTWEGTMKGNRGSDYDLLKSTMARGLIALVDRTLPGFAHSVRYEEVATPLSIEHYTSHSQGCFYGLPLTPQRLNAGLTTPETPIPGLFLTGQDAGFPGIVGATMAGWTSACRILGPKGYLQINQSLSRDPGSACETSDPEPTQDPSHSAPRMRAQVVHADWLSPHIREIVLKLPRSQQWTPGQYALIRVAPFEWRPYSLASASGETARFLIDVRTKGKGAAFADGLELGDKVELQLPLGNFEIHSEEAENEETPSRRRVFIATGSGIAPFCAAFEEGVRADDVLLFGCARADEDLTLRLETPIPPIIRCITRESSDAAFKGRVTDYLRMTGIDPHTDYYVCGSPAMVADVRRVIRSGGGHVYCESF